MMNVRVPVLSLAMIIISAGAPAHSGETLDRVMKSKQVVQVTSQGFPPFASLNAQGVLEGFDVDVMNEIAKRLGVKSKVETPSWEIITAGKWQGRWDICVCSMTPTKERRQVLDFPGQYYIAPAVIVTHVNNTSIKAAADLNGKKVGVEAGSTYEKYLQKNLVIDESGVRALEFPFEAVTIRPYDSEEAAFQDLRIGDGKRLDAVAVNYINAKEHVAKQSEKFKIVGEALFAEPISIATDKGDPEWNDKIASIITAMKKDGTLKAISVKWIGNDITGGS